MIAMFWLIGIEVQFEDEKTITYFTFHHVFVKMRELRMGIILM